MLRPGPVTSNCLTTSEFRLRTTLLGEARRAWRWVCPRLAFRLESVRQQFAAQIEVSISGSLPSGPGISDEGDEMSELNHLVKAVRENLSKEDRRLLHIVYGPPDPDRYDGLFDRVLEQLKSKETPEPRIRPRFP